MPKKTPLYDWHVANDGKMVSFSGYLLPVQYQETGVIREHLAVRNQAGIFDVSHMGEVIYKGKDALKNIQKILANDFSDLATGRVRYSVMCNEAGGVIDDLLVYKLAEENYLLIINAGNREKDVQWMEKQLFGDVVFEDISDLIGQIALQGPESKEILEQLTAPEALPQKYYTFFENVTIAGIPCLISRTGYTGSFGYELYCEAKDTTELWQTILAAGKNAGLIPCGLGARDTLRLEASMPLYGHEMNEDITPFEAGLGFSVKMNKEDFIGKQALLAKGAPKRTRIGIELIGRGIVREQAEILLKNGQKIGETTSGTYSPYLEKAMAMALVEKEFSAIGTEIDIIVRNKKISAKIAKTPFYKS